MHRQLAGPLLALRQRRVNHVLLGDTHLIADKLGDHRHMAGVLKLAPLLPDQQRTSDRRTAGAVGEGLQRQNIVIDHFAQETQGEDFISHPHIGEDKAIGQEQKAARKLHALPFMPHILITDVAAKRRVIRVVLRI